ncbi:tail fiber assembly protein [Pseudomonas entomophila]|uniref:tail fiber assembly protein n=1 Tax=Pseudomonas entomophila TaxID=312306 RepID=UPI0015E27BAA|nr:tail fiber assembly protein [Pseudomonas entomophila]MBA1187966.1 tail fiber assembly protein [Pseudomonas entomophila]
MAPIVCNLAPRTGEFLSSSPADPSPLEPGVWLFPAHICHLEPPVVPDGFVAIAVEDGQAWQIVANHRGAVVYSTETGAPQVWQELGDLPAGWTLQAPVTEFDTWGGEEWVVDEAAKAKAASQAASRKKYLLEQYATSMIATLQDAVELNLATQAEIDALKAWRVFRVQLSRLETTPAAPPAEQWPASPNMAATENWLTGQGFQEPATDTA